MAKKQQPKLRIIQESGESEFELNRDLTRIGRSTEADLIINEKSSSRLHAEISNLDGECYVKDLESRNGTFLNGNQISGDNRLKNGDEIRIGRTMFIFVDPNDAAVSTVAYAELSDEEWETIGTNKPKTKKKEKKPEESVYSVSNLLILVSIFGVFGLVGIAWLITRPSPEGPLQPINLPQPDNMSWGRLDASPSRYAQKVVFRFNLEKVEAQELGYKVFDNDFDGEVIIFVNGNLLGKAEATKNNQWSIRIFAKIFEEYLQEGENLLTFENMRYRVNPNEYWGIGEITVGPIQRMKCDVDLARANFRAGSEKYEHRNITKSNLYEAVSRLQAAVDATRTCEPRPDFYVELTTLFREADAEYRKKMEQYWFTYEQTKRRRDLGGAQMLLEEILEVCPDPAAEDYRKADIEIRRLAKMR